MNGELRDQRILVTGAAGGIGSEIVRQLTAHGASLMLADLDSPALRQLQQKTGQQAFAGDLGSRDDRSRLINLLADRFGALDGMVYCAGINAFGLHDAQTDEQIERILRINLVAPMQLTRGVIPLLERGRNPVIVHMGSVFGHIGFPGFSLYSASKFGLHGYTETLRRELAGGPVKVAWISPRATRTPINAGVIDDMNSELKVNYDPPARVARAVVNALAHPTREKVIGFPEKWFARINQVFPGIVDRSLFRQLPVIQKYNAIQKETLR